MTEYRYETGALDLGLSLPELKALGLDSLLSEEDLSSALNGMSDGELARFARACGLPVEGKRDAVKERILKMYKEAK